MDKDYRPSPSVWIIHKLNKALLEHEVDEALAMLCVFLKHHNLEASPHAVGQIPLKPGAPDPEAGG